MPFFDFFRRDRARRQAAVSAQVVPEPGRCVQCGICSFYCPITIDVRRHAWLGEPVRESYCLTCGECVARCPRGVLHFEPITLLPDPAVRTAASGMTNHDPLRPP